MSRGRFALALCVASLLCAVGTGAARGDAPTVQELTITASGGTQLACGLILPAGAAPAGGWPGVLLFPGLSPTLVPAVSQTHAAMETIALDDFAPAGIASLTCEERGTGDSQGTFDVAGPNDVADVQALFAWFAARPDVSDTEIGAYGESIGGAEVWNAAVAGVPFEAIVPVATWTNLKQALFPNGQDKTALDDGVNVLNPAPGYGWETSGLAARSPRGRLKSLTVPTLMVQSGHDLLFDLEQARTGYTLLPGPKRLYIGDPAQALGEVTAWFAHYLAGGPPVGQGVEIVGPRGNTEVSRNFPATRSVSVNLPGTRALDAPNQFDSRGVRLPGGPFETLGGGSVTVRYSGAHHWYPVVATVSLEGSKTSVTQGIADINTTAGVVKIPLLDEAAAIPRGKRIVVSLGLESRYPEFFDNRVGLFWHRLPSDAAVRITQVTLTLHVIDH